MGNRRMMLLIALLPLLALGSHTVAQDAGIDPGRLTWWRDSWAARPIEVSRNNASSSVTLTFKFRTSHAITNGCLEVYFPSALAVSGNMQQDCVGETYSAGQDVSYDVSGITLPNTAGAIGPFMLITRHHAAGQIVDIATTFASIYVADKLPTNNEPLTVDTEDSTSAQINKTKNLTFKLRIDFDIWEHDIFVLTVPSLWTSPSGANCSSLPVNNETVIENNVGSNIDCAVDRTNRKVFIYGAQDEIDVSELGDTNNYFDAKFQVNAFVAPQAAWAKTSYVWQLEVLRFGTRTAIKRYQGDGPTVNAGTLTVNSWTPHNGYPATNIVQGLTMFTDITFTLLNPLPAGGKLEVNFSGVTLSNLNWNFDTDGTTLIKDYTYFHNTDSSQTITETFAEGKITGTFSKALPAGSQIVLSSLVNFVSNNPTVQPISYYQSAVVDTSTEFAITYNTTGNIVRAQEFELLFSDLNGGNDVSQTGTAANKYIRAYVKLSTTNLTASTTSELKVHLPINNTGVANNSFYVSNDTSATGGPFILSYDLQDISGISNSSAASDGTVAATSNPTEGYISATGLNFNGQAGGVFSFYNNNNGIQNLILPAVAQNKATFYESWIEVTVGNITYVRFNVIPLTAVGRINASSSRPCGNTAIITLTPQFTAPSNSEYLIELTFDTALEVGLDNDVAYPFAVSSSTNFSAGIEVKLTSSKTKLVISKQASLTSGTNYVIYVPIVSAAVNFTTKVYFVSSQNVQQVIMEKNTNTAIAAAASAATHDLVDGTTYQSLLISATTSVSSATALTWATASNEYFMQFPEGFTFNGSSVAIGANGGTDLKIIQSTDIEFKFPTLISTINPTDGSLSLTGNGVVTSPYSNTFAAGSVITGYTGKCGINGTANHFGVTTGALTISSQSPTSIEGRSFNSYKTTISMSITIQNKIPVGGTITFTVDSVWNILNSSCTVTGLSNLSAANPITCARSSGSTFIVSSFDEVATSTNVTVSFDNVIPPENNTSGNINVNLITAASTQISINGVSKTIDTATSVPTNVTQVTVPSSPGTITMTTLQPIPTNGGFTGADLYLQFKLTHFLPANGQIEINAVACQFPINTSNTKNYVYFTKKYSTVTASTTSIVLTLSESVNAGEVLEFYAESALTNPASSASTTPYILLKATYYSIVFDLNSTTQPPAANQVKVTTEVTAQVTIDATSGIAMDVPNANSYADYTLIFSSAVAIDPTDEIWIRFPDQYDPYIGYVTESYPWYEPGIYYLECASTNLGNDLVCVADRWYLKLKNLTTVAASSSITLSLYDVMNPASTGNGTTDDFAFFHLDSTLNAKAFNLTGGKLTITALPPNLTVKRVAPTNNNAFAAADYTFEFYATATTPTPLNVYIILPDQYLLNLSVGESTDCAYSYQNHSDSSTDLSDKEAGSGTCTLAGRWVIYQQSTTTGLVFDATTKQKFQVNGLRNPEFGLSRSKVTDYTWDFDANDDSAFTIYDNWTTQMRVSLGDPTNKNVVASSYLNMNAAYLGFATNRRNFTVNSYNPNTKENYITVLPGTQTGLIYVRPQEEALEPLVAKSATLTPSTNQYTPDSNQLTYTSPQDFIIFKGEDYITFQISADINITRGVYYIDWEYEENKQRDPFGNQYDPPPKTMVEVAPKYLASITVGEIASIERGYTSFPVPVTLQYAPNSGLAVDITVAGDNTTGITIQPTTLEFQRGVTTRYFQITVASDYDFGVGSSRSLNFAKSGTDDAAYDVIDSKNFSITVTSFQEVDPVIQDLDSTTPTRTSVSFEILTDTTGYALYFFAPYGTDLLSFEDLESLIGDYWQIESYTAPENNEEVRSVEVEPSTADESGSLPSWTTFQRRLYAAHLEQRWYGITLVQRNVRQTVASFNQLYAGTKYSFEVYVKSWMGTHSLASTLDITTVAMAPAANFIVTFQGQISNNFLDTVLDLSALTLGLSPKAFTAKQRTLVRRLQQNEDSTGVTDTVFTYTLAPIRGYNIVPYDEVLLSESQEDYLLAQFLKNGIVTQKATFSRKEIARDSYTFPEWSIDGDPVQGDKTETTIDFTFSLNTDGQCCGLALIQNDNNPSADQILLGLSEDNDYSAPAKCLDIVRDEKTSIQLTGLTAGSTYNIYLNCYDLYPVWPNTMEEPLYYTTVTMVVPEEDDDWSGALHILGILVILLA